LLHIVRQLCEKKPTSLRAQLSAITPQLEEFRSKRDERAKQFLDLKSQIQKLSKEIQGDPAAAPPVDAQVNLSAMQLNVTASTPAQDSCSSGDELADLSLRKLEEYRAQLQALQRDKVDINR
jgi:protein regulator of cytokinesis 1